MNQPAGMPPLIQIAGLVYNRDHIVKVDLTKPDVVVIHTTTGADPYSGTIGEQVRHFFAGPPAPAAAGQAGDSKPQKRTGRRAAA
jgi:hypothetical protein